MNISIINHNTGNINSIIIALKYLGFKVSSGYLKTELKEKAQEFIQKAFKKNNELLINSKTRIESNWANINNKFFIAMIK